MTAQSPLVAGLAITLIAYIIGTIPFGVLVARWVGAADPRTRGSGNIGCTNVLRVAGRGAAAATLVLDAGKGLIAVWTAEFWIPDHTTPWTQVAGIAVVLGHTFPVWTRFRGGKGVATGIGALGGLSPLLALGAGVVWGTVLAWSRYVSLASVVAALVLPIAATLLRVPNVKTFSFIVAAVVVIRHRDNILRLAQGTESRLDGRAL
ncbi:MAG: glycerol-3-phosphate 1-O-acyltransferase PlsY [Nitrospirota bacterium]